MQWLSGRVLDSRPKGRGFEPHWHHCVVSLSKNINPSLVLVQPSFPFITERLLMGRNESNQTNKQTRKEIDIDKVTRNVAQYPRHSVTYLATKFEVAKSNELGGGAFTRKYIIWPLLPSTLYIMWPIQLQSLKLLHYKKIHFLTLTPTRSHKMLPSTLYIMWPIQLQSLKLLGLTV